MRSRAETHRRHRFRPPTHPARPCCICFPSFFPTRSWSRWGPQRGLNNYRYQTVPLYYVSPFSRRSSSIFFRARPCHARRKFVHANPPHPFRSHPGPHPTSSGMPLGPNFFFLLAGARAVAFLLILGFSPLLTRRGARDRPPLFDALRPTSSFGTRTRRDHGGEGRGTEGRRGMRLSWIPTGRPRPLDPRGPEWRKERRGIPRALPQLFFLFSNHT